MCIQITPDGLPCKAYSGRNKRAETFFNHPYIKAGRATVGEIEQNADKTYWMVSFYKNFDTTNTRFSSCGEIIEWLDSPNLYERMLKKGIKLWDKEESRYIKPEWKIQEPQDGTLTKPESGLFSRLFSCFERRKREDAGDLLVGRDRPLKKKKNPLAKGFFKNEVVSSETYSFKGAFSKVDLKIGYFIDKRWRFEAEIKVHDTSTVAGGVLLPGEASKAFPSREKCLEGISRFIDENVTKNYRYSNPKSVDEIAAWVKTIGEPEFEQETSFSR